ncbi:MAG: hypothetical protein LBV23_03195, partial [Deltaproteobacteria bacterium]|nr:hypothetical protein [Deltaproteobacteria bacterium]
MVSSRSEDNNNVKASANLEGLWLSTKDSLAAALPPSIYKAWIAPLKFYLEADDSLTIETPNDYFKNYIQKNYAPNICAALSQKLKEFGLSAKQLIFSTCAEPLADLTPQDDGQAGQSLEDFDLDEPNSTELTSSIEGKTTYDPFHDCPFNPLFTFNNFVVGPTNHLAYETSKSFAQNLISDNGLLLLVSDHGLGKTHLSQASGRLCLECNPQYSVRYLTCEDLLNELSLAIKKHETEDFKRRYRLNCDLMIVEGAAFMIGKIGLQNEFCLTIDQLLNQGKKVILTSTVDSFNMKVDPSLKSRLSSALTVKIGQPEFQTRLGILQNLAQGRGLKICLKALELLADNIKHDVRALKGAIHNLWVECGMLNKNEVDIDMARGCLALLTGMANEGLGLNLIFEVICRYYNLEPEDLNSKSRKKNISEARNVAMYLARELTSYTLKEIATAFGRTHPSAIYSINKVEDQMAKNPKLSSQI